MEYPTFITTGTSALYDWWPFDRIQEPEMVTIHEFGHQFWQGLVASNEFEEAWLDEGMTSYSSGKVFERHYPSLAEIGDMRLSEADFIRIQNNPNRIFDWIRKPSWTFDTGQIAFNVYARPELVLRTLEAHLGEATMARVMRTYHERWRFRHPSSDDFYAVASEVSGRDLRPLLTQLFESGALLDYEIGEARSERAVEPAGYLDGPKGRTLVPERDPGSSGSGPFVTTVVVRRRGDVVLPVPIEVTFRDGHVERLTWPGTERWKRFTFTRGELDSVRLDPRGSLILDVDWLNNSRRLTPDRRPAASLASRWLFVVQQVVSWLGL